MGQLTYDFSMAPGFPGQRADSDRYSAISNIAAAAILFGIGLVLAAAAGSDTVPKVRVPNANKAVLTFSGALITSNSVAGNVVVTNAAGVQTTTALTATVFATDDDTTLAAIATKIAAVSGVASAVAGTHNITVLANADTIINLTGFLVTLGGGQATAAVVRTTTDTLLGASMQTQMEKALDTGTSQYAAGDPLPVMTQGRLFVTAEQNVSAGDPVYVRYAAGTGTVIGSFRKDADTSTAALVPGAVWRTKATAGNVAVIELNLPA